MLYRVIRELLRSRALKVSLREQGIIYWVKLGIIEGRVRESWRQILDQGLGV